MKILALEVIDLLKRRLDEYVSKAGQPNKDKARLLEIADRIKEGAAALVEATDREL